MIEDKHILILDAKKIADELIHANYNLPSFFVKCFKIMKIFKTPQAFIEEVQNNPPKKYKRNECTNPLNRIQSLPEIDKNDFEKVIITYFFPIVPSYHSYAERKRFESYLRTLRYITKNCKAIEDVKDLLEKYTPSQISRGEINKKETNVPNTTSASNLNVNTNDETMVIPQMTEEVEPQPPSLEQPQGKNQINAVQTLKKSLSVLSNTIRKETQSNNPLVIMDNKHFIVFDGNIDFNQIIKIVGQEDYKTISSIQDILKEMEG